MKIKMNLVHRISTKLLEILYSPKLQKMKKELMGRKKVFEALVNSNFRR